MDLMQRMNAWVAGIPKRRKQTNHEAAFQPERRTHRRMNARAGTRVLIIDDSDTAQFMIKKMFTTSGYVAMQSKDPDRGLRMACYDHPDLVILDIGLPGMNGFEVLKLMRKDPLASRIPVIMISGNPRSINIFRNSRVDADGFIKKPFTRSEIFTRVEKMLNQDRVPKRLNALRTKPESGFLKRFGRRLNNPLTV